MSDVPWGSIHTADRDRLVKRIGALEDDVEDLQRLVVTLLNRVDDLERRLLALRFDPDLWHTCPTTNDFEETR